MKKFMALALALVLAFSLNLTAFAATTNYGAVTLNSRYEDNSIKQVTLNAQNGWTAKNGNTIKGTFYVIFPKGTQYQLPSAEECWAVLANSYYGGKENTGGYNYVTPITSYNGYGYGEYIYSGGTYVYVGANNGDYTRNNNGTYAYVGIRTTNTTNNSTTNTNIASYNGAGYGDYISTSSGFVYVGSYNGDYVRDGNSWKWVGYNTNYRNSNNTNTTQTTSVAKTNSQSAAESQFADLRKFGEDYGWSVDWRPSASIAATNDACWYLVSCARPVSSTQTTYFSFSVYTEKVGNSFSTRFKVFENGQQISSYTLAEIENALKTNGATYGTLPCNVYKVNNASQAGDQMISLLRTRLGGVSAVNNGYSTDSGMTTMTIARNGYATSTVVMRVEKKDTGLYRCTFTKNGATLTTLELLTLFG